MVDILIIEDNLEISELLMAFLTREGYQCMVCSTGEEGLNYLKEQSAKLVLLDLMLPGMDGFSVCDEIHKKKNLPLMIVSARSDKEDKLNGLELGADDYIEKPFDVDLLLAKVKALYRRHYDTIGDAITSEDLTLQKATRRVLLQGREVNLNAKEFALLLLLMTNKGKVLTKEYIFDTVWGDDCFSEPSSLTVHIKWLREKLEKDPKKPTRILTVWGVGYQFKM